jgi:hypothetical protein
MRITEGQLRRIIREELESDRYAIVVLGNTSTGPVEVIAYDKQELEGAADEGFDVVGGLVGCAVGFDVVGLDVVGLDVVGGLVGFAVGFDVVGGIVGGAVGFDVVGFDVVGLDVVGLEVVGGLVVA